MIRRFALALGLFFVAQTATAFDIDKMSDDERAAFNEAVRAYLLENPEVIFEAVDVYEAREAELKAQSDIEVISSNADEIFNDGRSWVGGNPSGDVNIVEFLDYRCGYCKKAFEDVRELVGTDDGIRFVIKEFPILGEESMLAARFAIAVRLVEGAEAYEAVHDELMLMRGAVTNQSLGRISSKLGIDFKSVKKSMGDPRIDDEIRANYALAQKLSVSGTPSFVIETEMLRGYAPLSAMREIVSRIRG